MAEVQKYRHISIAADPSLIIDLFTVIHPKNDINGQVIKSLEQGSLRAEDWENVEYEHLPKLLQDRSLGSVIRGRYYYLENVYQLLQEVLKGDVKIYITPLTASCLTELNSVEEEFLNNYITRLSVRDEDSHEIYEKIYKLANQYKENEQKVNTNNRIFEHDYSKACLVAEASYCGLPLITNDLSLVRCNEDRYGMTNLIRETNRLFNDVRLGIKSKGGKTMTPSTMVLASFISSLREGKYYLYPQNRRLRTNKEDNTIALR